MLLTKNIDIKLLLQLSVGFILFTIIGTVSHELGHFTMARLMGYEASINYSATFYDEPVNPQDAFWITTAGPLQTMLTGTIGFILLYWNKYSFLNAIKLNFRQWIIVFISLFWLRQVFNFLHGITVYFMTGNFPERNDEIRIASEAGIHHLIVTLATAAIASCILAIVVFRFIPVQQRLTFLVSGLIGGLSGFCLWFGWMGSHIMP